jgi:hypothetical protein
MPRYAKANTTKEELTKAIFKLAEDPTVLEENNLYAAVMDAVYSPRIYKDLHKIEFDCENVSIEGQEFVMPGFTAGFDIINGFSVLWVAAGGDWEQPLAFILYLDNKNKVRGYVPMNGNVFDKIHKAAYGNYEFEELEDGFNAFIEEHPFDMEKMTKDIKNRIQPI